MSELTAQSYGFGDSGVLEEAASLAPELFTALLLATKVEPSVFPINSRDGLEKSFLGISDQGTFVTSGGSITLDDLRSFPDEFLPIIDGRDLIRKAYMGVVISHQAKVQRRLERMRNGTEPVMASHPLPEGF